MRPSFRALWAFAASLACLEVAQVAGAGGMPEIDLVFPRNETYAPTRDMPVVFAFQNWDAKLVSLLWPGVEYQMWYTSNSSGAAGKVPWPSRHEGTWANWSSHNSAEPYFFHNFHTNFTGEGTVEISWWVRWLICGEHWRNSSGHDWSTKNYRGSVTFTVKKGGRAADLEAATADKTSCTTELGVAINATSDIETREVFNTMYTNMEEGGTCAVVDHSDPAPTPSPCLVQVSSAAAASISASWTARVCKSKTSRKLRPEIICSSGNAAREQLALGGVTCLAAALGAVGFLLA
jgi:hypothetical protein